MSWNVAERDNWFDYYAMKVYSEINGYNNWCDLSFLIYIPNVDYVLGQIGYESSIYYKSFVQDVCEQMSFERWMEILSSEYANEFFVERCFDSSCDSQCIVYADSIQWGAYGKANIFITVPVSEVEKLMEELEFGSRFIININERPQLVVSYEGVEELSDYIDEVENDILFESENYMIIRQQAIEKVVEYCVLVPQEEF